MEKSFKFCYYRENFYIEMKSRLYFIGFFLLLCLFTGIEYFLSPPLLYEGKLGEVRVYEAD